MAHTQYKSIFAYMIVQGVCSGQLMSFLPVMIPEPSIMWFSYPLWSNFHIHLISEWGNSIEFIMGELLLIISKVGTHHFCSVPCPELSCMVTLNARGSGKWSLALYPEKRRKKWFCWAARASATHDILFSSVIAFISFL